MGRRDVYQAEGQNVENLAWVGTVMQGSGRVGQLAMVHERTDRFEGAESSKTLRVIFFP